MNTITLFAEVPCPVETIPKTNDILYYWESHTGHIKKIKFDRFDNAMLYLYNSGLLFKTADECIVFRNTIKSLLSVNVKKVSQ